MARIEYQLHQPACLDLVLLVNAAHELLHACAGPFPERGLQTWY